MASWEDDPVVEDTIAPATPATPAVAPVRAVASRRNSWEDDPVVEEPAVSMRAPPRITTRGKTWTIAPNGNVVDMDELNAPAPAPIPSIAPQPAIQTAQVAPVTAMQPVQPAQPVAPPAAIDTSEPPLYFQIRSPLSGNVINPALVQPKGTRASLPLSHGPDMPQDNRATLREPSSEAPLAVDTRPALRSVDTPYALRGDRSFSGNIKESYRRNDESVQLDLEAWEASMGLRPWEEVKAKRDALKKRQSADPIGEKSSIIPKVLYDTAGMLPAMGRGLSAGVEKGLGAAVAASVANTIGPEAGIPAMGVAYAGGQVVGSVDFWARQGAGMIYADLRDAGVTHETAQKLAPAAGGLYAAIEYSQIDKIIPGLGRAVEAKLKQTVLKRMLKLAGKGALNVGVNTLEEAAQQAVGDSATSAGKYIEGLIDKADIPDELKTIAWNSWTAAKQAMGPMAVLQVPGAAVGTHRILSAKAPTPPAPAVDLRGAQRGKKPPVEVPGTPGVTDAERAASVTAAAEAYRKRQAAGVSEAPLVAPPPAPVDVYSPEVEAELLHLVRSDRQLYPDGINQADALKVVQNMREDTRKRLIAASTAPWDTGVRQPRPNYVVDMSGQGTVAQEQGKVNQQIAAAQADAAAKQQKAIPTGGQDAIQKQGAASVPLGQQPESGAAVRGRDTAGEAVAGARKTEPPVQVPTATKEPWEMTKAEYARTAKLRRDMEKNYVIVTAPNGKEIITRTLDPGQPAEKLITGSHRLEIAEALQEGKPVPAAVLADYPDLTAKGATEPAKPPDQISTANVRKLAKVKAPPATTAPKATAADAAAPIKPAAVKVEPTAEGVTVSVPSKDKPGISGKEQKKYLLAELDKAIEGAQNEAQPFPRTPAQDDAAQDQKTLIDAEKSWKNTAPEVKLQLVAALFKKYNIPEVANSRPYRFEERVQVLATKVKDQSADLYPTVTIEVPGDGEFTIRNDKKFLQAFKERAAKKFPTTVKSNIPAAGPEPLKKPTPIAAVKARPSAVKGFMDPIIEPFTSNDPTRPILGETHLDSESRVLVATDGWRMAVITDVNGPTVNGLTTEHANPYPNWRQAIPGLHEGESMPRTDARINIAVKDTEKLIRQLRQAKQMASKLHATTELFQMPDGTLAVAANSEVGEYRSHQDLSKAKYLASLNGDFLEEALTMLRKTGNTDATLSFTNEKQPFLVLGKKEYVVQMPMRFTREGKEVDVREYYKIEKPQEQIDEEAEAALPKAERIKRRTAKKAAEQPPVKAPGAKESQSPAKPIGVPHEIAKQLLSLPIEQQTYPIGDNNRLFRQRIIKQLTGKAVPASKAGATAVRDALLEAAGISKEGKAIVEYERELAAHLEQQATPAPGAAAEPGKGGQVQPKTTEETAVSTPPRKEAAIPADKQGEPVDIQDFGEKIGGARKDTADRGYSRGEKTQETESVEPWRKKYVAMKKVDGSGWTIGKTDDHFGISARHGQLFATQEEAEKAIPLFAVADSHSVRQNNDGTWALYKRVTDRKYLKVVAQDFSSREEAMKYMALHAENLLNTRTSFGEEILPVPEIAKRTGIERRTKDATPEMFNETFAPRGIEFGNWNNQEERQQVMNHAYDGLMDLADTLGIPPKALMLNGELAIAFGARGQGLVGAKAHYERDYGVINLTKMKGAGSLAHEWMHALDHYLARLDTKAAGERVKNDRGDLVYPDKGRKYGLQSYGYSYTSKMREELKTKFNDLVQSFYRKAQQYVEDTTVADKFLSRAKEQLRNLLDESRKDLARDMTAYHKSKGGYSSKPLKFLEPASADKLAEFDRLADSLVEGGNLETRFIPSESSNKMANGRYSNDTLEALNAIFKAARNRSEFRAEGHGALDKIAAAMRTYRDRIQMLNDAKTGTEKTKTVTTNYAIEAKKMDQARSGDYWSEPHEMTARAFAAYVEDKIAQTGGQSDFLVYHAHGGILLPMIDGFVARPYPEGQERVEIGKMFDAFVKEIKTRETDKGVAMYRTALPAVPTATEALSTAPAADTIKAKAAVRRVLGPDARIEIVDRIFENDAERLGKYQSGLTTMAQRGDMEATGFHEAYHGAEDMLFTGDERARAEELEPDAEKRADAFMEYAAGHTGLAGKLRGLFARLWFRIKALFGKANAVDELRAMHARLLDGWYARRGKQRQATDGAIEPAYRTPGKKSRPIPAPYAPPPGSEAEKIQQLKEAEANRQRAVDITQAIEKGAAKAKAKTGGEQIREKARLAAEAKAAKTTTPQSPEPLLSPTSEAFRTGIKHEYTEAMRSQYGMEPRTPTEVRHDAQLEAEAKAKYSANPNVGRDLIDAFKADPRKAPSDLESVILQHETVLAEQAANEAHATNDASKIDVAEARIDDIYSIIERAGSESGRALRARRFMMDADFNILRMEYKIKKAQGGIPLSDDQRAEVAKIKADYDATKKRYESEIERLKTEGVTKDELLAESKKTVAGDAEFEAMVRDLFKQLAKPRTYSQRLVDFGQSRMDAAAARMKARASRMSAGIDPSILMDMADYGFGYIVKGVSGFNAWSAKMRETFQGIDIEKELRKVYVQAHKEVRIENAKEESRTSPKTAAESEDQLSIKELYRAEIEKHVKALYANGVTNIADILKKTDLNDITGKVHKILSAYEQGLTPEQVRDAFTDYGVSRPVTKDTVKLILMDLRRQGQLLASIERVANELAPLATGQRRPKSSQEVRELTRKLHAMMKEANIPIVDAEAQLVSAMQSRKSSLENQIADLDKAIKNRQRMTTNKNVIPDDAETTSLRKQRDSLRQVYDEMFPRLPLTDQQKLNIAIKAATRSVAEWEARLQEARAGRFGAKKTKPMAVISAEMDALKAKIAAAKDEVAALHELAFPKRTPEQIAIDNKRKRLDAATAEMRRRMAMKDFAPRKTNEVDISGDPAALAAQAANAQVRVEYAQMKEQARWKTLSYGEKSKEILGAIWDASRNTIASLDNSALGRQGWPVLLTHPKLWAKRIVPSLQAMSTAQSRRLSAQFMERPNYRNGNYKRAGLEWNEPDGTGNFSRAEDNFRLELTRNIPVLGKSVDASNRMYATALNEIRGEFFDLLLANSSDPSGHNTQLLKDLGMGVNILTGRGHLVHAEAWAKIGWAPRFLKSAFSILTAGPIRGSKTWEGKKIFAKQYLRAIGTLGLIYIIASLFDHDIEWDPRSPEFGNINIGANHTINLMGYIKPLLVFGMQMYSGQRKNKDGTINIRDRWLPMATESERGNKVPYGQGAMQTVARFAQSKAHPGLGVALSAVTGKTFLGQPQTLGGMAIDAFMPLSPRQVPEMYQGENPFTGSILAILNLFGFTVNVDWNKNGVKKHTPSSTDHPWTTEPAWNP